eukprot:1213511-Rhodomonas_salina.1
MLSDAKKQKRKYEKTLDRMTMEREGPELEPLFRQYNGCLKVLKKGTVPPEDIKNYSKLKDYLF